jgi:hypothetical protein
MSVLEARSYPVRPRVRVDEARAGVDLAMERPNALRVDGLATESCRRISLDVAFKMLVSNEASISTIPCQS